MDDLHVVIEPDRIVTATLILRSWSAEDAEGAFEIYGDPGTAQAIGLRQPVRDITEMRELLADWDRRSSRRPVPQGMWAVESADDGRVLGGATLLPFGPHAPQLVMGWHLRPAARGHGVAAQIGHALAHQAFLADDVDEVFVAIPARNTAGLAVAKRLGMTAVDDVDWAHHGVRLEVLRMGRADLHNIRPGISLDHSYDPDGLDDW
ncbi:GNAT family N-acetyltransferase [Myceligenerans pegani]|uniref:GNAT family N-acetyltransferase n=1 Tax=Myceligenerans pegani TaxID=2776917 RepID=A0ABR9MZT3_9MICO|nr:GNAT family N-acetyltransferase [Myceligenerans sp. TRM 65318]MBE1876536.1 GNAT family N-acetyltransferase [Myceligenerans sp. TRM 65318]MBE3018807.1 GNAT family N-acetyltransferase [Myceligenerans sp. TRM 65318]